MLFCKQLRFACEKCKGGHRSRECNHLHRIENHIIYAIKDRGRPGRESQALPAEERLLLVSATADIQRNRKCPKTNGFCFECPPKCCGSCKDVYLAQESIKIVKVVDNRIVAGEIESAMPNYAYDESTDYFRDAKIYNDSNGEPIRSECEEDRDVRGERLERVQEVHIEEDDMKYEDVRKYEGYPFKDCIEEEIFQVNYSSIKQPAETAKDATGYTCSWAQNDDDKEINYQNGKELEHDAIAGTRRDPSPSSTLKSSIFDHDHSNTYQVEDDFLISDNSLNSNVLNGADAKKIHGKTLAEALAPKPQRDSIKFRTELENKIDNIKSRKTHCGSFIIPSISNGRRKQLKKFLSSRGYEPFGRIKKTVSVKPTPTQSFESLNKANGVSNEVPVTIPTKSELQHQPTEPLDFQEDFQLLNVGPPEFSVIEQQPIFQQQVSTTAINSLSEMNEVKPPEYDNYASDLGMGSHYNSLVGSLGFDAEDDGVRMFAEVDDAGTDDLYTFNNC